MMLQDDDHSDPHSIMAAMSPAKPPKRADKILASITAHCLPPPTFTSLPEPITLCAWRIESPNRTCIFTGQHLPPSFSDFMPHTLSKMLMDERSKRTMPSAIHHISQRTIPDDEAVRASILHYAQTALVPYHEPTKNALDTALEEATACMIHMPPPENHARIALNQYSETQTASNGARYRDWICTYASPRALEKYRLESHILSISTYHQAIVPWKREPHTPIQKNWVCVRSSLPLEQRVIVSDQTSADPAIPRFTAFIRSAKSRLLQDLKSLPTRQPALPDQHPVDRQNVSTYIDEPSQQILVVYAPTNNKDDRLEFVSMTLLPAA